MFLFADADQTRFVIQEKDSIQMFELRKKEAVIEQGSDDEDEFEERKKKKGPPELKAERIWLRKGLVDYSEEHPAKRHPLF